MYVSSIRKWFPTYSSRKTITFVTSPCPSPLSTDARSASAVANSSLCCASMASTPTDRSSVHFLVTLVPSLSLSLFLPSSGSPERLHEGGDDVVPLDRLFEHREAAPPPQIRPHREAGGGGRGVSFSRG